MVLLRLIRLIKGFYGVFVYFIYGIRGQIKGLIQAIIKRPTGVDVYYTVKCSTRDLLTMPYIIM